MKNAPARPGELGGVGLALWLLGCCWFPLARNLPLAVRSDADQRSAHRAVVTARWVVSALLLGGSGDVSQAVRVSSGPVLMTTVGLSGISQVGLELFLGEIDGGDAVSMEVQEKRDPIHPGKLSRSSGGGLVHLEELHGQCPACFSLELFSRLTELVWHVLGIGDF